MAHRRPNDLASGAVGSDASGQPFEFLREIGAALGSTQVGRRRFEYLVVRRLSGARARARARSDAPWRSKGIAATKHERPERAAVRAAAAESLDSVRSKPV